MISLFTLLESSFSMDCCEVGLLGVDIILRVIGFEINGAGSTVIFIMCKLGVCPIALYSSRVETNIVMVGSALDEVIIALVVEGARQTSFLVPDSIHNANLMKVRNRLDHMLETNGMSNHGDFVGFLHQTIQ